MTFEQPQLREDLVFSRQESREGSATVIKDPVTGRFFRFGAAEQYIAGRLDGETPIEVIRRDTEEKFGVSLPPATCTRFLDSLRRCGLLEHGQSAAHTRRAPGGKRVFGQLLYLRLKAFDPDRLFNRLTGSVRHFFTPAFIAGSAGLILLALAVAAGNWGSVRHELSGLYRFDALVRAWVAILAVTTLHEFAHGLTCKHFGGEVHDMGFLLIYFQPAFYCNVSEAWLLPKKSQRLWVTFAGAYFELFIWAMATLVWRLTEPGTAVHWVALIVTATSAIKSFFNLNPLIKLDGYYLLSDYLGIPNLRSRSFAYLRSTATKLLLGDNGREVYKSDPRAGRIYITYGLLAGVYSYWLLSLIVMGTGRFLTARYQGFGFVIFTFLLGIVFQRPLKRILPSRAWWPDAARIRLPGFTRKRAFFAVALAAAAAATLFHTDLTVSSEFRILPGTNAEVRAEVAGIVDEVYVDEGDVVRKGQPVARLSGRDLRAEIDTSEATMAEKRAKLRMLMAGTRQEEIELARSAAETARTRSEFARSRYAEAERIRAGGISRANASVARASERQRYAGLSLQTASALWSDKLISRQDMDKAEQEAAVTQKELEQTDAERRMALADDLADVKRTAAVAEGELEEARAKLRILLAGSRPEEIEAIRAEIAGEEVRLRNEREQLRLMTVVSPISGVVTTPRLKEKIGQLIDRGDLIAAVHELTTVTAEIRSPEKEIAEVKAGQRVVLKARAFPLSRFEGTVSAIAPVASEADQAEQGQGAKAVLVRCRIDNRSLLLKPEMTGRAKIYCGKRSVTDVLTRRIARYVRVEFWSWW
jgi:putative peptide zinc metalloprotease protein